MGKSRLGPAHVAHVAHVALVLVSSTACTSDEEPSADGESEHTRASSKCQAWEREEGDRCVDPATLHEPVTSVDENNVAGDADALQQLTLPPPPHSGFRLIVPVVELGPGEELTGCFAWPYPEFKHHFVYAARMYTTGGLHHSNLYGVPLSKQGASPYPACHAGQASIDTQLPNILAGNILDVLFANSTQVVGPEAMVLPEGMAFELTREGREITTNVHFLNPTDKPRRVEVVYDLYTRPEAEVEQTLVPYYFDNLDFEVPAKTTADVVNECPVFGGHLVTMMAHAHRRTTAVRVELLAGARSRRVLEMGAFDDTSDIRIFDTPVALGEAERLRQTCTVRNDLDGPIDYGIGDDEMCTLFGYMYPPSAQVMGVLKARSAGCTALNIGQNRAKR